MSPDNARQWVEPVLQLLFDAREIEALAAIRLELGQSTTEKLRFNTSKGKTEELRDRTRLANLFTLSEFLLDEELWDKAVTAYAWTIKLSEDLDEPFFLESSRFCKAFCHKMLGQRRELLKEKEMISADKTFFVGDRMVLSVKDLD
ncbi:hypothetical protein [Bradyrhizobium icense]|uniref:Uncharacterized protein n=1 Tax=Bradyrhizobium icense TaxID=1274631 RepID=A0A1B1UM69_9BRAD|nr:hypothetical protein [Bradyrhizobium icense]ANW03816.1 hypothetical protein LMTR13_30415 [Bradyrhizobium icense]